MSYTFERPDAPSTKRVQYYEMMGHRALYADGWKAVTRHQAGTPFEEDDWELYNLAEDRSECHNLAAAMPDRVADMVDRWWEEAEKYGVLPLDDRTIELFGTRYRPLPHRPDRRYRYFPPMSPLTGTGCARPRRAGLGDGRRHRPSARRGGVLYASGTENSGVSLFVQDDRLVLDYNCFGDHYLVESAAAVPVGRGGGRGAFPANGPRGHGHAAHRRRRQRDHGRPLRHDHHLERGPDGRLRPRVAGQPALQRSFPLRGQAVAAGGDPGPPRTRDQAAEAEVNGRAAMGRQ